MAEAKKTLRVTQTRSAVGRPADQGKTLKALGLGKIGRTVEQVDNESVQGEAPHRGRRALNSAHRRVNWRVRKGTPLPCFFPLSS